MRLGYASIANNLDCCSVVFPVTTVSKELDSFFENPDVLSAAESENWNTCKFWARFTQSPTILIII